MRVFKFWNEAGEEKETEQLSLKKAIMSVQSNFKDKMISVEYISKKGKKMEYCNNCGHECHCGSPCMKEHTDGDGKKIQIECCKQCRCETPTNK